jgi:hypothetical protein
MVNFFLILKSAFFYGNFLTFLPLDPDPRSGFPIRIRIHKVTESGSNPDPDPQPCLEMYSMYLLLLKINLRHMYLVSLKVKMPIFQ